MRRMQSATAAALAAALAGVFAAPAAADAVADFYKSKPVTILVPSGAGGLNALYARTVGDRMDRARHGRIDSRSRNPAVRLFL